MKKYIKNIRSSVRFILVEVLEETELYTSYLYHNKKYGRFIIYHKPNYKNWKNYFNQQALVLEASNKQMKPQDLNHDSN